MSLKAHFEPKFVAGTPAGLPGAGTPFIPWDVGLQGRGVFPVRYPFLGIVVALAAIYVLGVFVTSLAGRYLLRLIDWVLTHLPWLRDLYRTWKQIAVTPDMNTGVFARVVTIPDESGRLRM